VVPRRRGLFSGDGRAAGTADLQGSAERRTVNRDRPKISRRRPAGVREIREAASERARSEYVPGQPRRGQALRRIIDAVACEETEAGSLPRAHGALRAALLELPGRRTSQVCRETQVFGMVREVRVYIRRAGSRAASRDRFRFNGPSVTSPSFRATTCGVEKEEGR